MLRKCNIITTKTWAFQYIFRIFDVTNNSKYRMVCCVIFNVILNCTMGFSFPIMRKSVLLFHSRSLQGRDSPLPISIFQSICPFRILPDYISLSRSLCLAPFCPHHFFSQIPWFYTSGVMFDYSRNIEWINLLLKN